MGEDLLQAIGTILETIITSPEERWKVLTDRDGGGMTPVHLAIRLPDPCSRWPDEVSTYMF